MVASVYSLSSAAPHLFDDRLTEFDTELGELLAQASLEGHFSEQMGPVSLDLWRT